MTLTRPNLIKLFVPLFVFTATFLAVKLLDSPTKDSTPGQAGAFGARAGDARVTDARIASLQSTVRDGTSRPGPYAALGDAYLQKARETFDPS